MAIQAMTQLAETILDIIDWGIPIVTILIIWEAIMAFSGKKDNKFDIEKSKIATWGAFNKEGKRLDRTKMVNQYLAEEKEEKKLQGAVDYVESVMSTLQTWDASKEIASHNDLVKLRGQVKNAKSEMESVRKYFRILKKNTWRNNSKLNHILDDMEKFNKGDVAEIRVLENDIMKLHKETADEIVKSEAHLQAKILKSQSWKALMKLKIASFGASGKFLIKPPRTGTTAAGKPWPLRFNRGQLTLLIREFGNDLLMLKSAFAKQAKAKQEMQGLIAKTREFYK
jgi:hypothetical protein